MFYLDFFLLALVFNTNFAKIFVDLQSNENTLTQFENYVKIARTESISSIGACGIAKNPSFPINKN